MEIQVTLSPQTEQALRIKAASIGQSLEEFINSIADREARASNGPPRASTQTGSWSAEWRAWGEVERNLPLGIQFDDSRESIYAGRGE